MTRASDRGRPCRARVMRKSKAQMDEQHGSMVDHEGLAVVVITLFKPIDRLGEDI